MFDFLDQVNLVSASLIDSSQADLPQKEKILRIMDEWFSTTL